MQISDNWQIVLSVLIGMLLAAACTSLVYRMQLQREIKKYAESSPVVAVCTVSPGFSEDELLDYWAAVTALHESGGDHTAIGDHGKSRGAYQITEPVWKHYCPKVAWKTGAHDPDVSREVCKAILRDCIAKCRREGQIPSFENVRHYYTHGGF